MSTDSVRISSTAPYYTPHESGSTALDSHNLETGEETYSRLLTSTTATSVSGSLHLTYFTARKTEDIGNVRATTGPVAAGATPTLCRMGFYSVAANGDIALLAACANDTTLFAAASTAYQRALTATFSKVAGIRYAFGILVVSGAALPSFPSVNLNVNLLVGPPRLSGHVTGQADLPASVLNASVGANVRMYYGEALP